MGKVYLGVTGVAFMLTASLFALQNTPQNPARSVSYSIAHAPRVAGATTTGSPVQMAVSPTSSGYTLTVTKAGTGSGLVYTNLTGINCGTTCSSAFASGANPILYAQAAAGSTFTGWSGDCTPGESPTTCFALMNGNKSVTATFTTIPPSPSHTLTVVKVGSGSGIVFEGTVLQPGSVINCGSVCSASFLSGASVTLNITPATGSTFTGWSGIVCSPGTALTTCTFTMTANKQVTATFGAAVHGVDLIISDVAITSSSPGPTPSVGDIYLYGTVTLKNLGDQTATINPNTPDVVFGSINYPPTDTRAVQISGFSTGTGTITIGPGESKVLDLVTVQNDEAFRTRTGFLATAGPLTLYFMVDAHNSVSEANEANNVFTYTLNVSPASGTNASLKLISPNGGEQFSDPLSLKIQWSTYFYPSDRVYFYMLDQDATGNWSPGAKRLNGLGSSLVATGTWGPTNYTAGSFMGAHKIRVSNNPNEIKGMCLNPSYDPNSDCSASAITQIYAFDDSDTAFTVGTVSTSLITNLQATSSGTSAVITWSTSLPTDSIVMYVKDGLSSWSWHGTDTPLTTTHSVVLPSLEANSLYSYYVNAKDATGNITKSDTLVFSTGTATTAGIKLITPNDGERWPIGSTQTITWQRSGTFPTSAHQTVVLYQVGSTVPTVLHSGPAGGQETSFSWTINSTPLIPPGRYTIQVLSHSSSGIAYQVIAQDDSDAPFTITNVSPSGITALKAPVSGSYAFKANWTSGAANINFYDARRVISLTAPASAGDISLKVSGSPLPNTSYIIFDSSTQFHEYLNIGPNLTMTALATIQLTSPLVGSYTTKAQIVPLLGSYWGQMPTPVGPSDLGTFQQGEEIKIGFVTQFHESLLGPFVSLDPARFFYTWAGRSYNPDNASYVTAIDDGVGIGPLDANIEMYYTPTPVVSPYPITIPTVKANNPLTFELPYPPTTNFGSTTPPQPSTAVAPPISLEDIMSDADAITSDNLDDENSIDQPQAADLFHRAETIIAKIKALQHELASITPQLKNFIALGTPSTQKLGQGERAGVVSSFTSAFGKAPSSDADWQDVIKIANGRWPAQRSDVKEQQAEDAFTKIYKREPERAANAHDDAAVTVMSYGLRPADRNLASEAAATKSFTAIYGHAPTSAADWDAVRAIAYSGAKR